MQRTLTHEIFINIFGRIEIMHKPNFNKTFNEHGDCRRLKYRYGNIFDVVGMN